jgi:hypothetical protein
MQASSQHRDHLLDELAHDFRLETANLQHLLVRSDLHGRSFDRLAREL